MLRDYTKSMKHYWHEAAFIPELDDTVAAWTVASRLRELRGDDFTGGFVLRRFETFASAEARTWWVNGRCRLHALLRRRVVVGGVDLRQRRAQRAGGHATIRFGSRTTVARPAQPGLSRCCTFADQDTSMFPQAVKVADPLLDLRGRTLRLLALVSDGDLANIDAGQKLVTPCTRRDCAVLWLRPRPLPGHTFAPASTVTVANPLDAVAHIADSAVTALERA